MTSDLMYEALVPKIGLYLSNNALTEVPGEIYHLRNLSVLSLRSNYITEILPSIANLTNLMELNLGSNQLRVVPYELLTLADSLEKANSKAPKFNVFPNPLIRPVPAKWPDVTKPARGGNQHFASTRVAFLDMFGMSRQNCSPAPSSLSGKFTLDL